MYLVLSFFFFLAFISSHYFIVSFFDSFFILCFNFILSFSPPFCFISFYFIYLYFIYLFHLIWFSKMTKHKKDTTPGTGIRWRVYVCTRFTESRETADSPLHWSIRSESLAASRIHSLPVEGRGCLSHAESLPVTLVYWRRWNFSFNRWK